MQRIGSSYRQRRPDRDYDVVVIGSGVGGLATAALLARHAGRRALVLERHYMPGGFSHVFLRHGYEWDVGLHYIGGVAKRSSTVRRLFDHIGDGRLEWAPMGDAYDRIVFDDRSYDYVAGPERFCRQMTAYFPRQAAAIERYVDLVRTVARRAGPFMAEKALPRLLAGLAGPAMRAPFRRHSSRTTASVLAELTSNRELAGVLAGQWGDYGLPPGQSSFGMHAILARHYLWGGSYPVGGSSALAASMAPAIEDAGGDILYNAEVAEILVNRRRAVGVRMADGGEIRAPVVVSDAGVANTFGRLLPQATAERAGLASRLRRVPPSVGHLCLYAGLEATAEELHLPRTNLWIYPGPDHDANVAAFLADPQAPLPVVYVSFPSAKDPDFARRCPGKATIELITLAPWEAFARWADRSVKRRGEEYEALKTGFAERMLAALDTQLPGLSAKIDYMEVSTPLSTRHYAGYERGEIYGIDHSPQRFDQRWLRPRTPIPNLYLTGQDVVTAGIAAALASGYLTASAILGRNLLKPATRGK